MFTDKKNFIIFFIISTSAFLLWLIGFYPGAMSSDSMDQWNQATTRSFHSYHPFVHTIYIFLLKSIWNIPAVISLFQIVFTAFLVSYLSTFLIKHGIKRIFAWLVFLVFILSPFVGIYNVTLWKDVLYTQLITITESVLVAPN